MRATDYKPRDFRKKKAGGSVKSKILHTYFVASVGSTCKYFNRYRYVRIKNWHLDVYHVSCSSKIFLCLTRSKVWFSSKMGKKYLLWSSNHDFAFMLCSPRRRVVNFLTQSSMCSTGTLDPYSCTLSVYYLLYASHNLQQPGKDGHPENKWCFSLP